MFINNKTFYGIDDKEIRHLFNNMIPIWNKDENIDEGLLFVATTMLSDQYYDCFNKYIFTKTSLEICNKINISGRVVALIEPQPEITDKTKDSDVWGHISLPREFYRYSIAADHIFVIHLFLRPDPITKIDTISYSVWKMLLGGKADQYVLPEYCIPFFQLFTFLKYTEPEIREIPSGKKVGTKKNGYFNLTNSGVHVVDSNWNTTVIRIAYP